MRQMNRTAYIILTVLVVITLLHVGYRLFHGERANVSPPGSRGERLETWDRMRRLELTDDNLSKFVSALLPNQTLPVPDGTSEVAPTALTATQRTDIRTALMEFFMAYRQDDPHLVYDYLAVSRGPTQLIPELKMAMKTDKEVFEYLWNEGSKGIGWGFLLEGSGQCGFWKTNTPLAPNNQSIQGVLTDPELFGNVTAAGHIFTVRLKKNESLARGEELLFCDVFFGTELNKAKDQDPCATGVRFWWDNAGEKWIPDILIFVTPEMRQDIQVAV
jgi:hypothetical protein